VLLALHAEQSRRLRGAALTPCFGVEMRALPALCWLRTSGAPFDGEQWRRLSDQAVLERARAREALAEVAGDVFGPLDPQRPLKQGISHVKLLRLLTSDPYNLPIDKTASDILAPYAKDYPIVQRVLSFRDAHKRAGTYGLKLVRRYWDADQSRIFAGYTQIGAASGRTSCSKPNLQNVPGSVDYRGCFKAPPGYYLVHVDLGQAELRVMAEVTGDEHMIEALNAGCDLHDETATAVFGLQVAPTPNQRKVGKVLNFGISYGMGPRTFGARVRSAGNNTPDQDAARQHATFFRTYPGVALFHERSKRKALPTEVRSMSGRRRLNCDRFTHLVNTPIQAGATDMYKAGLALLWERKHEYPGAELILSTHDDVVLAVPDAVLPEDAMLWVQRCLEDGERVFLKRVDPSAKPEVGPDWGWFSLSQKERAQTVDFPEGYRAEYGTTQVTWICPHRPRDADLELGYCGRCDRQEDRVIRDLVRVTADPDYRGGDDEDDEDEDEEVTTDE
jgi:DNA polymerase-1